MSAPARGPIRDVDTAARRVLDQIGPPLHLRATVAALEGEGLRDADASLVAAGCRDLFELGAVVHERCAAIGETAATLAPAGPSPLAPSRGGASPAPRVLRRFARSYWDGVAYTLPLIAQGLCIALVGTSLWGSARLTTGEQTAIALALVLSLIATGPFTHAMSRRLFYYWFQWDVRAVQRTATRWVAAGALAGVAAAAAAAAALAVAGRLDAAGATFVGFLALQPALWMGNSALFVIRQAHVAAVAVLVPTVGLWAALRAGAPPVAAHVAGLAAADVLLLGAGWWLMRRRARGWPQARPPLPRALMPRAIGGYAAWGLVYFGLIFGDRLVAWWAGGGMQWRPAYEAALQIALVPMLLTLPILEHIVVRLGEDLKAAERSAAPARRGDALRRVESAFLGAVATAVAVYAGLAVAVWLTVEHAGDRLPLDVGRLVGHGEGRLVLLVALVADGVVIAALGLGSAYQLLGRPWPMVAAGAPAVVADIAVAALARHAGAPEHAVFGLLAGGVCFAAGMAVAWRGTRRRLGYWWYAAS